MHKLAALIATLTAGAAVALIVTSTALAGGITCDTDASAEIAGATVTGPRTDWTPPVWTFDMPDLSTSVDVQADTESEAATKAEAWLSDQVAAACAAQQAQTTTTTQGAGTDSATTQAATPTYSASTQAQQLAASAIVTGPRTQWNPPEWTVTVPSLNLSVDVGATSEAAARIAALPVIDQALGNDTSGASTSSVQSTTAITTGATTTGAAGTIATGGAVAGTSLFGDLDPAIATALKAHGG